MTNTLAFWILQRLYVYLLMSDLRSTTAILNMHEVLGQLQPILVAFEERQAAIKNKATPLMQQIQAAQAEKREIDAETKAQLDTLGDQNQALELEVQPFTWNADQLDTISQAMKAVIEGKGTLDPQLQGWSNLEALAAIVQEYKIKGL